MQSSPAKLSNLVKELQKQVDLITSYLEAENQLEPTFAPLDDLAKLPLASLPREVEEARKKAYSLSWGLNTLLSAPGNHVLLTAMQVVLYTT